MAERSKQTSKKYSAQFSSSAFVCVRKFSSDENFLLDLFVFIFHSVSNFLSFTELFRIEKIFFDKKIYLTTHK
jgi:hypothetical protein